MKIILHQIYATDGPGCPRWPICRRWSRLSRVVQTTETTDISFNLWLLFMQLGLFPTHQYYVSLCLCLLMVKCWNMWCYGECTNLSLDVAGLCDECWCLMGFNHLFHSDVSQDLSFGVAKSAAVNVPVGYHQGDPIVRGDDELFIIPQVGMTGNLQQYFQERREAD